MESRGKENFTELFLSNLKFDKDRYEIRDAKTEALFIRVNLKKKTFFVRKRIGKDIRYLTIGDFPETTLKSARKMAVDFLANAENGKTYRAEKKKEGDVPSVKEFFFDMFIPRYADKMMKPRTEQGVITNFRLHIDKDIGFMRIDNVEREDVEKVHNKAKNISNVTANRILTILKTMFNKAIEWRYVKYNPTLGVKKFPTKARERFLQPNEISKLFEALEGETNLLLKNYILMSVYTGQRRSNVLSMRWSDIDMTNRIWHIPETKNGSSLNVPLIPQAVDVLRELKKEANSEWVFPSSGKTGHFVEPKKGWKSLLQKAQIKDLRLHDLRRTLGSYEAMAGVNLPTISRTLGHASYQATQVYARLNVETVRDAMSSAVNLMKERAKEAKAQN